MCVFVYSKRERCNSTSSGVGGGLPGEPGEGPARRDALDEVQAIAGNKQCCDCGEAGPDWASINLGITLCIVCSGIHRYTHTHTHTHAYTHTRIQRHTATQKRIYVCTHTHTHTDLHCGRHSYAGTHTLDRTLLSTRTQIQTLHCRHRHTHT